MTSVLLTHRGLYTRTGSGVYLRLELDMEEQPKLSLDPGVTITVGVDLGGDLRVKQNLDFDYKLSWGQGFKLGCLCLCVCVSVCLSVCVCLCSDKHWLHPGCSKPL